MEKQSSLTFGKLTKNLAYVKIVWNGKVIFDDHYDTDSFYHLLDVQSDYNNKIVYEMNVKIVDFHHCILTIKGEE